jgi:hypothetical protein
MNGTIPGKMCRLAWNLAAHPGYLTRYVADNVIHHRTPLELQRPWFSYAATDFLETYVQPQMTVCEYGSGGSTIYFAKRTTSVVSIEDNPEWYALVTRQLKKLKILNAELRLCPFNFKKPINFEKSAYLHAIPDRPFDIYVIDGSEEWDQVRPYCFWHVEERIQPGGIIILDDSWRYPMLRQRNKARKVKIFESVGPHRPGVTSTDVFFY